MSEKRYLVKFKSSARITEDEFVTFFEEKLFDENTKIKEIEEWIKSKGNYQSKSDSFSEILLSKPEQDND